MERLSLESDASLIDNQIGNERGNRLGNCLPIFKFVLPQVAEPTQFCGLGGRDSLRDYEVARRLARAIPPHPLAMMEH
jgi:hypothetical protein